MSTEANPVPDNDADLLRWLLNKKPTRALHALSRLSQSRFQSLMGQVLTAQQQQRKENQLAFYQPVSDKALSMHTTDAKVIGIGGGNGASKTETCLVEMMMCATGVFPKSVRDHIDVDAKFKGPINCRIVCESLTTVLHPIILPKLQWWQWTGVSSAGGEKGHWGWIPRSHLIAGSWQRSWSEKLRMLRVICKDPHTGKYLGESKIQCMSRDQDPSDFASGDFDIVLHDEPPTLAIWTENQARTMRVAGRMMLAMTWPDDPSIPVDWIFDKVYDPALRGDESIFWTEMWTTDNPNLDQEAIAFQERQWDHKTADVRIRGRPIRFSNRIHPLFTDQPEWWCFVCGDTCAVEAGKCGKCDSTQIVEFCHVSDFETHTNWPTVWLLDPHPRKPHMFQWWQIDPSDDLWLVADGECDGGVEDTRDEVKRVESELNLHVVRRLIDPNMGRSPASARRRNVTWQDEFDAVGLQTDLADDSDAGRSRINEYLKPDPMTWAPRIHFHLRCAKSAFQMKRYVWDEYRTNSERDLKQTAKMKNDDFPTMGKYLLNSNPEFHSMSHSGIVHRRSPAPRGHRERVWSSAS